LANGGSFVVKTLTAVNIWQMVKFLVEIASAGGFCVNFNSQCHPFPDDQNIQRRKLLCLTLISLVNWMVGCKLLGWLKQLCMPDHKCVMNDDFYCAKSKASFFKMLHEEVLNSRSKKASNSYTNFLLEESVITSKYAVLKLPKQLQDGLDLLDRPFHQHVIIELITDK
jgi:hypothetical protein